MKHKTLLDSPRYRSFVNQRDQILEQMHRNAQVDISRLLYEALSQVEGAVSRHLIVHRPESPARDVMLNHQIQGILGYVAWPIFARMVRLRRNVFVFTATSEAEAIAQGQGKEFQIKLPKELLDQISFSPNPNDEDMRKRIQLSLHRIGRDIEDAIHLSNVMGETPQETLERVKSSFPKVVGYKVPPRELKPLKAFKEAEISDRPKIFLTNSIMDDSEWQDAVDAYKQTELPPSRFDEEAETLGGVPEGYNIYNWEAEANLTHDFVEKVRMGQEEAAKSAGIQDFVWIAILDDKTDECCSTRSGMSTTEIENALDSGNLDSDVCEETVPPAHLNCRCKLVPMGDTVEKTDVDWGTFDDWIEA